VDNGVQALLKEAATLYGTVDFGCVCTNGPRSAICCVGMTSDKWVPSNIADFNYGFISGQKQASSLLPAIFAYIDELWINTTGLTQYNDEYNAGAYTRTLAEQRVAVDVALFDFTQPLIKYSNDEVDAIFGVHKNQSLWHVCWGVLSQVFVNIPMSADSADTDAMVPRTLRTFAAFDPVGQSLELNVSVLENYVERITFDACRRHHSSGAMH
jgi:hypothetical protein